jgi:hypothetical protein
MKQQFVLIHTILKAEIPTLVNIWVTNSPHVKMLCPQKYCLSIYFRKNITCLRVVQLTICKVCFAPFEIVYRWVTINCCVMNDVADVNQLFIADVWGCVTVQSVSLKTDLNVGNMVIKL